MTMDLGAADQEVGDEEGDGVVACDLVGVACIGLGDEA